jgi:hypothetical protein
MNGLEIMALNLLLALNSKIESLDRIKAFLDWISTKRNKAVVVKNVNFVILNKPV